MAVADARGHSPRQDQRRRRESDAVARRQLLNPRRGRGARNNAANRIRLSGAWPAHRTPADQGAAVANRALGGSNQSHSRSRATHKSPQNGSFIKPYTPPYFRPTSSHYTVHTL